MSVEGQARRDKVEKSTPTLIEVSVAVVVAFLLVMTGIRLVGGFAVDPNRGGHAAIAAENPPSPPVLTRSVRPVP